MEKLSKDRCIILSTHIISDIESSCDHAAVINQGEVLFRGSVDALAGKAKNAVWELTAPYSQYDRIEKEYVIISSRKERDHVVFRILASEKPNAEALPIQPGIEDGYMALINGVIA